MRGLDTPEVAEYAGARLSDSVRRAWKRGDEDAQVGGGPAPRPPRCPVHALIAASSGWTVGLVLGIAGIAVTAVIVITIVALAMRIAKQAETAEGAVEVVRRQTSGLDGIARINDSGVRILHAARALRKVAVGK